jgi:hypothetical protein
MPRFLRTYEVSDRNPKQDGEHDESYQEFDELPIPTHFPVGPTRRASFLIAGNAVATFMASSER